VRDGAEKTLFARSGHGLNPCAVTIPGTAAAGVGSAQGTPAIVDSIGAAKGIM